MSVTLLCTPRSPFARRVRLALKRLGIDYREEWVDPFQPSAGFLDANPLGLVPVLVGWGAQPLPDSALILEELHERTCKIWPGSPEARTEARRLSTWAEGVMAAAVAFYLEGLKPHPDPETRDEQLTIIARTLEALARSSIELDSQPGWDLAVALEYVSLRCPEADWRKLNPSLSAHLEKALLDSHFRATRPPAA